MTQLPLPVTLNNGEWEVGLVDLIYPHTWYNIRNDNNIFGFDVGNGELLVRRVPPGCYETVPDILKGMHLELHQNKNRVYLSFCDKEDRRSHSSSTPENYKSRREDGEVVNAHYTRPHYVPVIRQQFQTIEMILRLHSGDLVPFERSRDSCVTF
ncbi:uncharacterized protein TNCV_3393231 [Trichonephila clavipes]|nr:uncharacterized protein TNCV_3393231 [Trichonephila clavipes]